MLNESLQRAFPEADIRTTISVGGAGKPNLKALGTTFWPDVEATDGSRRVVAIEVKLIRPRQRASHAIAEAIGQSMIYSILYPYVFTFIVHDGRSNDKNHDEDEALRDRLLRLNVELIMRQR